MCDISHAKRAKCGTAHKTGNKVLYYTSLKSLGVIF